MQYDDWSADFEVARLNDVHQFDDDEDGVVDRTVLEMIKLKEGSSTEPNTPYMIKAKEVGETTEVKLVEADNNSSIYSIGGVNVGNKKGSLSKGLYISNGKKFIIK